MIPFKVYVSAVRVLSLFGSSPYAGDLGIALRHYVRTVWGLWKLLLLQALCKPTAHILSGFYCKVACTL